LENVVIIVTILVALYLIGMPVLQFLTLLYYKFQIPTMKFVKNSDIPQELEDMISQYQKELFAKGFSRYGVSVHDGMFVNVSQKHYSFYYYNQESGVHAFVEPQTYKGAITPIRVTFETYYVDGTICCTTNNGSFLFPTVPKNVKLYDHYLVNDMDAYEAHLQDRQSITVDIKYGALDIITLPELQTQHTASYIQAYIDEGYAKKTSYGFRFKANLKVLKYAYKMVQEVRKISKNLKRKPTKSQADSRYTIISSMDKLGKKRGDSNPKVWFSVSVIIFVIFYGLFGIDVLGMLVLVLVLLFHELGHFGAMKMFGYEDTRMMFLPFGAITFGHKEHKKALEEYIVYMAGPLPGLVLGAILAWFSLSHPQIQGISVVAIVLIFINYLNLLPIYPLDGGRVVQLLFLLRYPRLQFYFYVASLLVLFFATVYYQDWLLLIFVAILAIGFRQNLAISRVLKSLESNQPTKEEIADIILSDERYKDASLTFKSDVASMVWYMIHIQKPSKKLIAFGGVFYFVMLLSPVIVVSAFVYQEIFNNPYTRLSSEQKKQVREFNDKLYSYEGLVDDVDINVSFRDITIKFDKLFDEYNITQAKPIDIDKNLTDSTCMLPTRVQDIYKWHNGVRYIFGEDGIADAKMFLAEYNKDTDDIIPFGDDEYSEFTLRCNQKGVYDYTNKKRYYSILHLLDTYAKVYEQKAFSYDTSYGFDINYTILHHIRYQTLSAKDKARYQKKLEFLIQKAKEYQTYPQYFRAMIVRKLSYENEAKLKDALKLYINDKEEYIAKMARRAINRL